MKTKILKCGMRVKDIKTGLQGIVRKNANYNPMDEFEGDKWFIETDSNSGFYSDGTNLKKIDEVNDKEQMIEKIEQFMSNNSERKNIRVTLTSDKKTLFVVFEVDKIDCILKNEISYIENISKKVFSSIISIRLDDQLCFSLQFFNEER